MTREEHLRFCKRCKHQMFDRQQGIICGLTAKIADFEESCPSYEGDPIKLEAVAQRERIKSADDRSVGKGLRLANYLIDLIFVWVFNFIFGFYLGLLLGLFGAEWVENVDFENYWLNLIFNLIAGILYYSILEFTTGRTLAKFITGTKVVTAEGESPNFSTILKRTVIRYIPFEPISFLFDDKSGWHDNWSETIVIRDNPFKKKKEKEKI